MFGSPAKKSIPDTMRHSTAHHRQESNAAKASAANDRRGEAARLPHVATLSSGAIRRLQETSALRLALRRQSQARETRTTHRARSANSILDPPRENTLPASARLDQFIDFLHHFNRQMDSPHKPAIVFNLFFAQNPTGAGVPTRYTFVVSRRKGLGCQAALESSPQSRPTADRSHLRIFLPSSTSPLVLPPLTPPWLSGIGS